MKELQVKVGILSEPQIDFFLRTTYLQNGKEVSGRQRLYYENGKVGWNGRQYESLLFEPVDSRRGRFRIEGVTIGINFHWERKQDQHFSGAFHIIVENDQLTGINIVPVETYLTSVISSEMSATASLELLKAHAVISRSWLIAQTRKNKEIASGETSYSSFTQTDDEIVRWYDREDHPYFDVCADEHCQRYQGITQASTPEVSEAIRNAWGEILTYEGEICDARFSKCCGGVVEEFQNCWENIHYPYLVKRRDYKKPLDIPDLRLEENAQKWIRSSPVAFCHTTDQQILSQVLNNYDQETQNFYRWKVTYTQSELAALLLNRSGIDFGDILDLIPMERGTSGRIIRLKIVGSQRTMIIGKELEIRRVLSESHLYSAAFVVDKKEIRNGIPQRFVLTGAGWGHGVGLCQIGAAVMGEKGYSYKEILLHYYPGVTIEKLYD